MYSEMSGPYPRAPAPSPEPRDRLSSQLVLDCASFRTMGWPSWRTLCTVMSALNVWISSARIGCLRWWSVVLRPAECAQRVAVWCLCRDVHFHALPEGGRALVVPCVYNTCAHMLACRYDELRSAVSEVADVRFGETSSILVALRILIASSVSCLYGW
jgi:hypothetical protein